MTIHSATPTTVIEPDAEPLNLGPEAIARLIPHRRPFVMVDRVLAYKHGNRPTLWARRQISANEPVFDGHFPGLALWPGVYTIEGLGQSTLICALIALAIRDSSMAEAFASLHALERSTRMPGAMMAATPPPPHGFARTGRAGHVDVKFLEPVYAGQALDYRVTLSHAIEPMARFDVVAEVERVPVARGTMTGIVA